MRRTVTALLAITAIVAGTSLASAKDKARVDELHASGKPPWHVWNNNGGGHRR